LGNLGVFVAKGDVGVGTIVGSAVFNIVCVIGICGLLVHGVSAKFAERKKK
jgi:sodium/potassium/calcium exchanger 3